MTAGVNKVLLSHFTCNKSERVDSPVLVEDQMDDKTREVHTAARGADGEMVDNPRALPEPLA